MPLQATSGAASYDGFGGGVAAVPNYIEDVFSTYLYNGTGATQTITNGIDLSTKGGLVWIKTRSDTGGVYTGDHVAHDTARGVNKTLRINSTAAQSTRNGVTAFNADGFTTGGLDWENRSGMTYASWTFREQPKFFDVVTWTGTGTFPRTITHNLGSQPGCIIAKATSTTGDWYVSHRSTPNPYIDNLYLNTTAAVSSGVGTFDNVTSTSFETYMNANGVTYVAYLLAHNAGGFGLTGTDNVISCGSFTADGSGNATVNLGYEPQYILSKCSSSAEGWIISDVMRGDSYSGTQGLFANTSGAEFNNFPILIPTATGFVSQNGQCIASATYIYIAIRRGPMKVPTSGTSVFSPNAIGAVSVGTPVTTNFPVDLQIATWRGGTSSHYFYDRLRGVSSTTTEGAKSLLSDSTAAETSPTTATRMWGNTGYQVDTSWSNSVSIFHNFRRAPSFFDEVCYTGTGSATTFSHNLGVAPEMMIVKGRSGARAWTIYHSSLGATKYIEFNTSAAFVSSTRWNDTAPTSSVFTVGTAAGTNVSTETYVAYLFATCAGVSKVGSYTGTGTTLQVDCGFTGGARFVLIKRTDSTGDWYVWDTARGIVAGNDPYLLLNSTAAEVTTTDYIDTYSAGFEISSTAPAAINASGGTFIFLAIA